jgi:enterochelin esterase-like enzyme
VLRVARRRIKDLFAGEAAVGLLGWPLLVVSIILALGGPAACIFLWGRIRGLGAVPARLALIVACQITAILAVGVGINDHFQFFASWSDLSGQNGTDTPIEQANNGNRPLSRSLSQRLRNDFRPAGANHVLAATLVGPRSGIRSKVWVWLPPQYHQQPQRRFPVVELFTGFPGTPSAWFHVMQGPERLLQAIKTGAAQPYILVAPTITVQPGHDTECIDVPHGPKVATWLTQDIRRIVMANFRALPGRDAWGTMGYSTGGYCAAKLAVQYPRLFRAGVSIAGYFSPFTSALAKLPGENLPVVIRQRHPHVDLLLATSRQDPGTTAAVSTMVKAAQSPTLVYTYVVPHGGHNTGIWSAMLPKCFQWLTTELTHAR